MSEVILRILFIQSAVGAGLIVLMLGLRKLFTEKVPHRLIYGLWLVVALRMLIPLELPGPIQMNRGTEAPVQQVFIVEQQASITAESYEIPPILEAADVDHSISASTKSAEAAMNTQMITTVVVKHPFVNPWSIAQWLTAVWLCGALLITAYMVLVNRRFKRSVFAKAVTIPTNSSLSVFVANVPSPCLVGVFKPQIVLNETGALAENLPFALQHELCHYKGLDHIWNLLRNVIIALFWFHPLVWLAAYLTKKDCERACDERVTIDMTADDSIAYARTLISLVSPQKIAAYASASFMATNLPVMNKRVTHILSRRRIQRWACGLFAAMILLSSAASFATGEATIKQITLPTDFKEAPLYYPTSGGLWVAMGGNLYRQNGDDTFAEVASVPSASQIAVDDEAVYILDAEQKQVLVSDHDGNRQKTWKLPDDLSPFKLEIAGDKLAVLSGLPMDMEYGRITAEAQLYLLNKQDGALTEVKLGTVTDVCADGKGGLLVMHIPMPGMPSVLVSRLNLRDLQAQTITETDIQAQGIAAEPGAIYLLANGHLNKYDEATGRSTQILIDGGRAGDALRDMRVSNSTLYAWDASARKLVALDVSEERSAGKTVLTIVNRGGFEEAYESAKEAFLARHPDVEFRDTEIGSDKYTTMMLAGDAGMDILFEAPGSMALFAEAGALVPIGDEPSIRESHSMAEWLPFEEIYSYSGKLYGIPSYVMYNLWKVDAELEMQTGFVMPEYPYTWRDTYEAAEAAGLGQAGKPVLMYDYMDSPAILYNYSMTQAQKQGTLQYDTSGFREDMEAYREMASKGIIVMYEGGETPNNPPALVETFADISDQTIPAPTVNGMEVALMQSYGFCVSAKSPNRDLAIEFLAEFAKPEHQYKGNYGYMETMLLKDISPYNQAHYDHPDWGIARYTERMEELRNFAAGKWVTWNRKLHPAKILEQTDALPRYLDGSISIDEFIRILQSKADMMQYE